MPLQLPNFPLMDFSSLPPAEQESAQLVRSNLAQMSSYCQHFHHALTLFDFCSRQKPVDDDSREALSGWKEIAARDAAMSLYHIVKSLQSARNFKDCPTFKAVVDHDYLRRTAKLLDERFPNAINIRNALAHSGETMAFIERLRGHSFTGSFENEFIKITSSQDLHFPGSVMGRKFTISWEGKIITYELSSESLNVLIQATSLAHKALSGLLRPPSVFLV